MPEVKAEVRSFIRANFYVPENLAFSDNASLLEHGIIDSTGVLELVTFIEENFGITVEDVDMVPQNLDSVESISSFIRRKKG